MKNSTPTTQAELKSSNTFSSQVVEVHRFVAKVELMEGVGINSVIEFANLEIGMVWQIDTNSITVLLFTANSKVAVGLGARLANTKLEIHAGENLLGRIVDPLIRLRDGGPKVTPGKSVPVFGSAPTFFERAID